MVNLTLDQVVREYLIEGGDENMNRYARMFQIAIAGLRELNMDTSGGVTSAELEITDSDMANLPTNFLSLIRVAICDGSGNLKALGMDPNLCLPRTYDECGNDARCGDSNSFGFGVYFNNLEGYSDNYRNGECVGRMFGIGGGNNAYGSYRIDMQRGTINFGGLIDRGCVVLEYLANLSMVDGKYQVHPFIVESLKSYMYWKDIWRNGTKNLGDKELAKRQFYLDEKQSRRRFNNTDIQTWLQALRFGNKAAPKF